ncbi:MAG: tRNA preQ1(34) S-adenosylmethionine ribosyltransferase-isomerase QueA [Candidatus Margulisiibacteriota bacterium]|nr:MAG: tRNA preQ1(34) S-adenosylmethionine ribosyltransferase-isomerase QueA [Candidatus Margulisbacteria bacterium GWD2_39_127]OGI01580.1 MAG: tRNA preQ1(34) S-adenosylmethionine ribosyltransferase-isomerase QueA [Candidatus Margulisbacteria bacterium GWF2_38_17]OGI10022.1 MAG: tRNA preQ1(34) S-adenosylmethionine ribosyltransferase-isomerase QueA [Candidatus Margulisbacteria bacterium GWE2_39_32]PZM78277.1 MAG: tRNA preQ1(34) S-adenosylmethionine ribosyltransferase-isomerase QueA [Candidatus M
MHDENFQLSSYEYQLEERYIAQSPAQKRDNSRLMVLDKQHNTINHGLFHDLVHYLNPGDVLVRNNTSVFPARIFGRKETGAKIEFLLLSEKGQDIWEVICRPAKRLKLGDIVFFSNSLAAEIIGFCEEGKRLVKFRYQGDFWEIIDAIGNVPLPPYINLQSTRLSPCELKERYQTVFASKRGSSAAPTAGLHFTEKLLGEIAKKGITVVDVTLHVGLGTFLPVKAEVITDHIMHEEYYEITSSAIQAINQAKASGHRVIAVGTTSVRVLETIADEMITGEITPLSGKTSIFIYPGYQFKVVDGIVTNFHLPGSSLLLLVSAFYNRKSILNAYTIAKAENYRFFSFGDAMFIS